MSVNPDVEQVKGNLVVRIDQDSDSELQALFDSVLKPDSKRPLQVPLRMRKLPNSFFNPPSTGSKSPSVSSISHSRENSADSAVFGTPVGAAGAGAGAGASGGLQVNHPRAHSSPASLQQTYASAGQQPQQPAQPQQQHAKQRSYDIAAAAAAAAAALDELGPLPPGWEQARTSEGQIYYLNHITQSTTWEDPRKSAAVQQQQRNAELLSSMASPPHPSTSPQPHQAAHLQRTPGTILQQSIASWLQQPLPQTQSIQATQQKLRLQSLQMERERLKLRQQEIMRQQDVMMRASTGGGSDVVSTGMDPFLSGLAEHSRQESADSGLGLGNNYSLPHTPDDFLSAMDDNMDGVSGDIGSLDSHDMSSLSDNIDSTDDLVPSLQIGEEFATDILNDVQALINPSSKAGSSLTWL